MGEGDKLGWGALHHVEGEGAWRRLDWEIDTPQKISGCGTVALEQEVVVKVNLDSAGGEGSSATGITELANGNEGCVAKGRKQMGSTSRDGKER